VSEIGADAGAVLAAAGAVQSSKVDGQTTLAACAPCGVRRHPPATIAAEARLLETLMKFPPGKDAWKRRDCESGLSIITIEKDDSDGNFPLGVEGEGPPGARTASTRRHLMIVVSPQTFFGFRLRLLWPARHPHSAASG
jgi:hypothetical protein